MSLHPRPLLHLTVVELLHGLTQQHGGPLPKGEHDLLGDERRHVRIPVPVTSDPRCELDRNAVRRHLLPEVPEDFGVELPAVCRDGIPQG